MPNRRMREARFVAEFVKDLDATAALRRIGFKGKRPDVAASKMMARPSIAAAVQVRQAELIDTADIDSAQILRELKRIAFSDVRELVDADGRLKGLHELDERTAAQIASIEVEELYEHQGSGEKRRRVNIGRLTKLKRWEKIRALELLGRHARLFEADAPVGNVGPGLTVIIQSAGDTRVGIATQPGTEGRVLVNLPGPG